MTDEETTQPTDEQIIEAARAMGVEMPSGEPTNYGFPQPEEKQNIHTFLTNVVRAKDTTKTGFLSDIELGVTPYSERTYKALELMSDELCNDDIWSEYFKKKAEILTVTSLSRNAKLLSLAVLQRRELADTSEDINKKPNSGWFKKKDNKSGDSS